MYHQNKCVQFVTGSKLHANIEMSKEGRHRTKMREREGRDEDTCHREDINRGKNSREILKKCYPKLRKLERLDAKYTDCHFFSILIFYGYFSFIVVAMNFLKSELKNILIYLEHSCNNDQIK